MSRNLNGCAVCLYCGAVVVPQEEARPVTEEEATRYADQTNGHYEEFLGLWVANADCPDCEAKYLAWMSNWPPYEFGHHSHVPRTPRFISDLSFRSTFNDEPGEEDLPKYSIVKETTLRRIFFDGRSPLDLHTVKRDWKEKK